MKYMLLCYDDEKAWEDAGPAALKEAMDEAIALTAVSVRIRDGKQHVTDGPFAETREVLGGYYIIDVENLDQAIHIAERHPGAKFGAVEIRPILEIPNLPSAK
jgi:hypothetical protein